PEQLFQDAAHELEALLRIPFEIGKVIDRCRQDLKAGAFEYASGPHHVKRVRYEENSPNTRRPEEHFDANRLLPGRARAYLRQNRRGRDSELAGKLSTNLSLGRDSAARLTQEQKARRQPCAVE